MPKAFSLKKIKTFCVINAGGAGMSAIAGFLAESKKNVFGIESAHTSYLEPLKSSGVTISDVFEERMLPNKQDSALIISSATPHDHPAIIYAQKRDIPIFHRSEALASIASAFKSVCVAGTHGKSTTTTLMFDAFHDTNRPLSILTGAFLQSKKSNFDYTNKTPYLICECDESDGSIIKYKPYISVITNIDEDHMEHDKSFEKLCDTFSAFVNATYETGLLLVNGDDPVLKGLSQRYTGTAITYGFSTSCLYRIVIMNASMSSVTFAVLYRGEQLCTVTLPLPGSYNAFNATPAIILAHIWGVSLDKVAKNLSKTPGLERRMQVLAKDEKGPLVIDDYAHHPKAVQEAIEALRGFGRDVVVILEPHRIRRLTYHISNFSAVLQMAAHVIITPVYTPNTDEVEGHPHAELARKVNALGGKASFVHSFEELSRSLKALRRKNKVLLFCSAGDLSKFAHTFAQEHYG